MEEHIVTISKDKDGKDYEKVFFVAKALSKTQTPPFTRCIHIESGRGGRRIVATDGRRLHVALIKQRIPTGNYHCEIRKGVITLSSLADEIEYPSWKNLIPRDRLYCCACIDLAGSGMTERKDEALRLSLALSTLARTTGESVNIRYLNDLTKTNWLVYCQRGSRLLLFRQQQESENVYALIGALNAA